MEKPPNLSAASFFDITEQMRVESGGQFFNAFDHPVFSQSDAFITDGPGSAGVITSTVIPQRQIQFALTPVGILASLAEVQMNDEEDMLRCSVETF